VSVRLAAIDLGTVTARLLIAEVDEAGVHELERHMRITHLGENLDERGVIGPRAIERELAACRDFLTIIDAAGHRDGRAVERVVAVATSAMRDALNSAKVCDSLAKLGLEVEVIGGTREARLSFCGALSGFSATGTGTNLDGGARGGPVLVVDVGGGSTEIVLGTMSDLGDPVIFREHSFDIGSRRVTDHFLQGDPPSADELSRAADGVKDEMRGYFANLEHRPQAMIAVAGTATSAVCVRDAMIDYDPEKVHGLRVSAKELAEVLGRLADMPLERRARCVGLEPGRAPVIVGGLIILQTILKLADLDSFTASETDILQGIALEAWNTL
jgi:exopolyphosphatase/guanosine-5'-triphosphate,3'-diphosphate pyrophosphatase